MIFILPDEGVSPQDLLADPELFEDMFYPKDWDEMKSYVLEWSVPKFSFDSEYDLTGLLPALGLSTAFDRAKADFSGISAGPDPLFLSSARQGVHIGIDEDGVEAAAYTALIESGAAEPPTETLEMDLDRPFLFAILSSDPLAPEAGEEYASGGTLLFVGVCGDPTAK